MWRFADLEIGNSIEIRRSGDWQIWRLADLEIGRSGDWQFCGNLQIGGGGPKIQEGYGVLSIMHEEMH